MATTGLIYIGPAFSEAGYKRKRLGRNDYKEEKL